jgi:hypothetical protein
LVLPSLLPYTLPNISKCLESENLDFVSTNLYGSNEEVSYIEVDDISNLTSLQCVEEIQFEAGSNRTFSPTFSLDSGIESPRSEKVNYLEF